MEASVSLGPRSRLASFCLLCPVGQGVPSISSDPGSKFRPVSNRTTRTFFPLPGSLRLKSPRVWPGSPASSVWVLRGGSRCQVFGNLPRVVLHQWNARLKRLRADPIDTDGGPRDAWGRDAEGGRALPRARGTDATCAHVSRSHPWKRAGNFLESDGCRGPCRASRRGVWTNISLRRWRQRKSPSREPAGCGGQAQLPHSVTCFAGGGKTRRWSSASRGIEKREYQESEQRRSLIDHRRARPVTPRPLRHLAPCRAPRLEVRTRFKPSPRRVWRPHQTAGYLCSAGG
jgi:hypothetical protein